ncbi:MAG: HAD family hydrolase [Kineosporiaceae bacterium]
MSGTPGAGRVRAVLLDIDDTLVDTRAAFAAAIDAMATAWLPHLDAAGRVAATAHWVADRQGAFRAYTRGELTMEQQRRARVADLHVAFGGRALDDEAWAAWQDGYLAAFSAAWRLRPGVLAVLDRLAEAGLPVGAVTNASRALSEDKLGRLGLAARVPVLSAVDDRGVGKPDPRMFLVACEALGCEPSAALYVGDEADVDALGAARCGLTGVWLDALLEEEAAARVWRAALGAAAAAGVHPQRLHRVSSLEQILTLPGLRGGAGAGCENGFGSGEGGTV